LVLAQPRKMPVQRFIAVFELASPDLRIQLPCVRSHAVLADKILPPLEEALGLASRLPAESAGLRDFRQLLARNLERMTGGRNCLAGRVQQGARHLAGVGAT